MKILLKISFFLFAISIVGNSFAQDVKPYQGPVVKKAKYDPAKNKPLKKTNVQAHTMKKRTHVKTIK